MTKIKNQPLKKKEDPETQQTRQTPLMDINQSIHQFFWDFKDIQEYLSQSQQYNQSNCKSSPHKDQLINTRIDSHSQNDNDFTFQSNSVQTLEEMPQQNQKLKPQNLEKISQNQMEQEYEIQNHAIQGSIDQQKSNNLIPQQDAKQIIENPQGNFEVRFQPAEGMHQNQIEQYPPYDPPEIQNQQENIQEQQNKKKVKKKIAIKKKTIKKKTIKEKIIKKKVNKKKANKSQQFRKLPRQKRGKVKRNSKNVYITKNLPKVATTYHANYLVQRFGKNWPNMLEKKMQNFSSKSWSMITFKSLYNEEWLQQTWQQFFKSQKLQQMLQKSAHVTVQNKANYKAHLCMYRIAFECKRFISLQLKNIDTTLQYNESLACKSQ